MDVNYQLSKLASANYIQGSIMQFSTNLNSLSVGNRIIDSEHKKLGGIITDIGQLILVNHVVAVEAAIRMLNDGLRYYFAVEEDIAQAVNFDFAQHRLAHITFLNKFQDITDKFMSLDGKWSKLERNDFIDSLNGLLIQHIQEDSKPLKIVLDTYLYDFKPK